jgi:hypothetical protein
MLIGLRNFAIIAVLALLVTVLPGGGNAVSAITTALSLIFLAAIALLLARTWEQTGLTRDSMSDRQRWIFLGAIGAIALMIAGLDELFETGAGTVFWLAVVAGSGFLIFQTWREANSY